MEKMEEQHALAAVAKTKTKQAGRQASAEQRVGGGWWKGKGPRGQQATISSSRRGRRGDEAAGRMESKTVGCCVVSFLPAIASEGGSQQGRRMALVVAVGVGVAATTAPPVPVPYPYRGRKRKARRGKTDGGCSTVSLSESAAADTWARIPCLTGPYFLPGAVFVQPFVASPIHQRLRTACLVRDVSSVPRFGLGPSSQ